MTTQKKSTLDIFGLFKTNKNLDPEKEKKLLDETVPLQQRYKILTGFTEQGDVEEIKKFYYEKYSLCYKIFLDSLQQFDTLTKQKNSIFQI